MAGLGLFGRAKADSKGLLSALVRQRFYPGGALGVSNPESETPPESQAESFPIHRQPPSELCRLPVVGTRQPDTPDCQPHPWGSTSRLWRS